MIDVANRKFGSSEPAPAKINSSDEQIGGPLSELIFTSAGDRRNIARIKR